MRKTCPCGTEFDAKRPAAKYCSDKCRKRAQRRPGGTSNVVAFGVVSLPPLEERAERQAGPLESAARKELEAVGRADALAGVVVLALARRLDDAGAEVTGTAYAALVKEMRVSLAAAVAGAEVEDDPVDQVRKQRERKQQAR